MLNERGVAHRYREYTDEPLSRSEIERILAMLGVSPRAVLRSNDAACRELGLTGEEPDARLVELMAAHSTLLQRPIGVLGKRAVVGRPVEKLLELVDG